MKTLKLTDKEAGYLKLLIDVTMNDGRSTRDVSMPMLAAIAGKLEAQPKAKSVAPAVKDCVNAMESVLGTGSVALPAHPDPVWYAKISASMRRQALTVEDFTTMAQALESRGWAPPYSFEKAVWGADRLLAEAKGGTKARGGFRGAPTELEEP